MHMVSIAGYIPYKVYVYIQWNPSKMDTIGEVNFVLYKKVSFIQGLLNAILIHFGTYTNVLYIKGVLNSGVSF